MGKKSAKKQTKVAAAVSANKGPVIAATRRAASVAKATAPPPSIKPKAAQAASEATAEAAATAQRSQLEARAAAVGGERCAVGREAGTALVPEDEFDACHTRARWAGNRGTQSLSHEMG